MIEIILIFIFILFIAIIIIFFIHSWLSRFYNCPFCGEKILKTDTICMYCSENLKKLDTVDKKIVTIGKSFREGAELRTKSEDEIEKRYEEKKSKR
ncbi:MAG: hypothetical protein JSV49_09675 [Thermoplasmata archaeon]|nr:MAG: hypothetical protein JSV49_09675 [Thermoplasmata archaeon]